tara:strand:- start:233166 stop:234368 length:1203 start_codon:yes stop_codon:yes gene_type:complete
MRNILNLFVSFSFSYSQTVIGEGLSGQELWDYVTENYKTTTTLGYTNCRDVMYSEIDIKDGNQLTGVYSGYTITLDLSQDPSSNAYEQGINCEHTFPQSMGSSGEPMKSDMHHLFPTKSNVNSSRGNDPFEEIPDQETHVWYRNEYSQPDVPTEFIDEYAEKYNPPNQSDERFEPREEQKGNTARAMFYFYAIYTDVSDDDFWEIQKETLMDWHYYDEADEIETERTWKIAEYQDGIPNPFVLDSTLARRIWYPQSNLIVEYYEGWNLVGLPLSVEDSNYQTQFLNAVVGTLYSYNLVYEEEINLENGSGYWLMINGNNENVFLGEPLTELNISLTEGWNLMTGISSPVQVGNIIDNGEIIIDGSIFGFDGVYQEAVYLSAGKGYWVKANSSGIITIVSD